MPGMLLTRGKQACKIDTGEKHLEKGANNHVSIP
jgi:hypothetical protein